jgi:hypothetical protein
VQLDGQHPVLFTQNLPSRSERHGETALISRTPRGGPGNRRNDSATVMRATSPCVATLNKKYNNLSPTSQPTSLKNPIPRSLNQSGSPSTTASKTRASGSDATPLPSRFQGDPTPAKLSVRPGATGLCTHSLKRFKRLSPSYLLFISFISYLSHLSRR